MFTLSADVNSRNTHLKEPDEKRTEEQKTNMRTGQLNACSMAEARLKKSAASPML